jgi:benzoyl-CoA reductase subunit C
MDTISEIHRIVNNRHDVAREWQAKTGGKVFGYLSINLPEELIYAAGILPVRILGSHEPQVITDPYMWNMMHCVSARDCLAQGLQGRYDYLDGLGNAFGCPHTRQCTSSWRRHLSLPYFYELYVPVALNGPHAQSCLRGEIEDFKHSLEEWTGKTITDEDIDHATGVYNQTRRLMTQLSELRKSDPPLISGAEFMEIALAGMVTDKEEFNILLGQLVAELSRRQPKERGGARLMLAGGCNSDIELIQSIESMGVRVVV